MEVGEVSTIYICLPLNFSSWNSTLIYIKLGMNGI